MAELENVIYSIERCICHVPDACRDCINMEYPYPTCHDALLNEAVELLKAQKTGRWINMKNGNADCSVCGQHVVGVYDDDNADKYCRHCGAKMDLGGMKMPIYRRGNCYTCGEESEYLLPEIGFKKDSTHFFAALLCPKCRKVFRKMREENGDFDEKID